jgi:hypothetical protein
MLSFSGSLRIFIALDPRDMRAGINTLHALVSRRLQEEVKNGARFVFTNKRRPLLKALYWDGTGCWLLTKRLEAGPSPMPSGSGKNSSGSSRTAGSKSSALLSPRPVGSTVTYPMIIPLMKAVGRVALIFRTGRDYTSAAG